MVHAITAHKVYKRFGKGYSPLQKNTLNPGLPSNDSVVVALNQVSFKVEQGEIFGLLGAGGAGKSTLLRLISTLLIPDKGEIRVFGFDTVREPVQVQRLINQLPAETNYFKKLSPVENLIYAARLFGIYGKDTRYQAEEILLCLGLAAGSINQPMDELSAGVHAIVAVARALLSCPKLLLMDEPTRGLDPPSTGEFLRIIKKLNQDTGMTILLTTRDPEQAEYLCDHIAIMENGKILALDTKVGLRQIPSRLSSEPVLVDVTSHRSKNIPVEVVMG